MEVRAAGRRQLLGERAVVAIGRVEIAVEDGVGAAKALIGRHRFGHDELQARARAAHDGRRLIGEGHHLDGGRLHFRFVERERLDSIVVPVQVGLEGEDGLIVLARFDGQGDARRRLAVAGGRLDNRERARLAQDVEQLVDAAVVAVALGQGDGLQVRRIAEVGGVKP